MRNPDEFDAFYAAARHRLLLQTYALTGDLPAARGAVRDAFVAAWHHWRKVSRLEDPEAWVRPHAWQHAQRRHTARLWHRDKAVDPELRHTFDALAKLTGIQRRALLLDQLGGATPAALARELGVTDEVAEHQLRLALATFPVHRDIPPGELRHCLEQLATRTEDARFPRSTIIRRAGAARRRAHTGAGLVAAVAALAIASSVVGQAEGVAPRLGRVQATAPDRPPPPDLPSLPTDDLLTSAQATALVPGHTVARVRTDDNTRGTGIYTACQPDRFADADGLSALVRRFTVAGRPRTSAIQVAELSSSRAAALKAYDAMLGWYAGCATPRVQLLSAHEVVGAGDEASLLVLRRWGAPVTTYSIGIARTGQVLTSVIRQVEDARVARLQPVVRALGQAVAGLCGHESGGTCTSTPRTRLVAPPAATRARGLLQVVDLPPVRGIDQMWVATDPIRPRQNPAATTCDKADFIAPGITWSATRSMLIPPAKLPASFGVSETIGTFRTVRQARAFVSTIRRRMGGCEDKDLTATLRLMRTRSSARVDVTTWHLTTEFADDRTLQFYVAVVRRDRVVAQVGFIPAGRATFPAGAFDALALRALQRMENLPRK